MRREQRRLQYRGIPFERFLLPAPWHIADDPCVRAAPHVLTHACISAHRGLPNKKMFTNLDEMKEDDIFLLSIMGEKLAYKVIDVQVVLPSDIRSLRIQKGKDLVTLITCTPYGVNTHRLYVTGERTTYKEDMENSKTETIPWYKDWWWVPVNIVLLIVLGYLLYQYNGSAK